MAQYCRYCTYMCCGDANFCSIRQKTYSDAYIKRPNKCRDFDFNPIDALGENPNEYKPKKPKADDGEQTFALIDWLWELENSKEIKE